MLVGADATGKTHVLKLLYAMQKTHASEIQHTLSGLMDKLTWVFRAESLADLVRQTEATRLALGHGRLGWGDVRFYASCARTDDLRRQHSQINLDQR